MSLFLILFYTFSFLAVYVQVFLLVTFFENRKKIFIRSEGITLQNYPGVTIIVPCYNEENVVTLTVDSLLGLQYPKDKLKIIIVDDGSKDKTWTVVQKYKNNPQVILLKKENGGKHTALNLGLEHATSEFVGCLDSDSSVHPEALKRIITFFDNQEVMAVAPSIIIRDPKNILQYAQRAEYDMAHYTKKMLAFLEGIHVTPGPFSIFRKEIFEVMGPYRKAHHTEDQEIALRMHKYGFRIEHCPDAYVYTGGPASVPKLFRQRVRWIYGFIQNVRDYKGLFFRPQYGYIGMFTLPSGIISICGTMFLLVFMVNQLYNFVTRKILQAQVVGFDPFANLHVTLDPFFINTRAFLFVSIILYILVIVSLLNGRRMIYGRKVLSWDIFLFIIVYTILAPFWLMKAVWNAIFTKEPSWTLERDYSLKKL
ncbi:glycosyltransferase family 2 protein [Candidatus Nomurabacteria bacterium]|nr:glycosyltransferase family 2 protein [Candidatus Nomurabacteria bacterium]